MPLCCLDASRKVALPSRAAQQLKQCDQARRH